MSLAMEAERVAREGRGSARNTWPIWKLEDGYAALARYVSPEAIRGQRLATSRSLTLDPVEADRIVAERLYRHLRELDIGYAPPPRSPLPDQQLIRHPELILEDGVGTCIDLAVLYASMCLDAQVGVALAITRDHAFVLVTPGRLRADPHPRHPLPLEGFAEDPNDTVLVGAAGALIPTLASGAEMAVDVVCAVAEGRASFAAAQASAREWSRSRDLRVVDVPWLHARTRFGPLAEPDNPPHMHTHTGARPARIAFPNLPRDRELVENLRHATGVVVLFGPAGQGKSTIARQLAEQSTTPVWLLDASEPQSLMKSLAEAELAGRRELGSSRAVVDRMGYAESALARLREATSRWIAVLDNADADPGAVLRWMPRPGEDQLVLVTTTNPAWHDVPGASFVTLKPLDPHETAMRLGGSELNELVAGRPLLLDAFGRYMRATGADMGLIARDLPAGEAPEPLRGPAALWALLRRAPAFGERELRLSAYLAHLPPDRQPLEVLETVVPGAREVARALADHGLVALGDEHVSMHRLFGMAIRVDLAEHDPQLRDEAVRRLAGEEAPNRLIDAQGDLTVITELEERLADSDRNEPSADPELGVALHGIARLLELHGQTRWSADAFARAQRHFDERHRELLADCLQGRAREVNQHAANDERRLHEAIEWARTARRILVEEQGENANADRCLAMEGLLRQKLARFAASREEQISQLNEALALIQTADVRRERRADIDEVELARSRFNLAGIRLELAKRDPARAAAHLDEARRVYAEVRERRRKLYGAAAHSHIAACDIGVAYVDYHRAVLLPAPSQQRTAWLRSATDNAMAALKQREAIEGPVDLDEASKATRFLAKVALARASSPVASVDALSEVAAEARRELVAAQILLEPVAPLPSQPALLPAAIDRWLRSPPLRAVVLEYESDPPFDAELTEWLDWLETTSQMHWDFRAGLERNLVRSPALSSATRGVVLAAARALGLRGAHDELRGRYDHVLILGGLVRACLARPLHAASLLRDGAIEAGDVTALGGFRAIAGDELGLLERTTGERVADEFDAMDAGVRSAFGVTAPVGDRGEDSELVGGSWRVREYERGDGRPLRVVAAPSSEPGVRRANTPDTYAWFATELARLHAGQRILIVTTEIYAPYQHADALRMLALPYGVQVDVAGVDPGRAAAVLEQRFEPHNYLQEIRSAIRAMRALHAALDDGGGRSRA